MKRLESIAMLAIAGGLAVHLSLLLVLRIEVPPPPALPEQPVRVQFIGGRHGGADPVLQQQALLFDSAPLFMPTPWNTAGDLAGIASLQDATRVFEPFPPDLLLPATGLPPWTAGTEEPSPARLRLPVEPVLILAGLRQAPGIPTGEAVPGPRLQALRLAPAGPAVPVEGSLPATLRTQAPGTLWLPARFHLQMRGGFVVGEPILAQSSGFPDWDQALRDHIRTLDFHRQLGDGYYQVSAFP